MTFQFYKYQATGNDFILIDDREKHFDATNSSLIRRLCNRRFGIGADGLILLRNEAGLDFCMLYFNADGYEGSMCGNGGRCVTAFAHRLFPGKTEFAFLAYDGLHNSSIRGTTDLGHVVQLSMQAVSAIDAFDKDFLLDTGSPHYVRFVDDAATIDVATEGRRIRNSEAFLRDGVNVNFVELHGDSITVRTYERGVEEETLSCGTGVTASALVAVYSQRMENNPVRVFTRGGELNVAFERDNSGYSDVTLTGEAVCVYSGMIEC
jgi:diaminopimelate epimerase